MNTTPDFDLCVIGAGINGAGIARDAAMRGLSVLLVEAQDIAGATSSASTKLIHGGLRYLETCQFRLVRESLREREILMRLAPHIIKPLDFVMPHTPDLRPTWMIRTGLFIYDRLGGKRSLPVSRAVDFRKDACGRPLKDIYKTGYHYSDCWVEDSRLVLLNVLSAAEHGARVMTRTACVGLEASTDKSRWHIKLRNISSGYEGSFTARSVINATGPWVRKFLDGCHLSTAQTPQVRLVKGSHIIVPRLYEGAHTFLLQQPDRRVVFVIPYEDSYTLIGTTDVEFNGDPAGIVIDQKETEYLVKAVNLYFKSQISTKHVYWTYSGVRPLVDDGDSNASNITRDYRLVPDQSHGPLLISVFGGKLTTYRKLSEHAVDQLFRLQKYKFRKCSTHAEPLPGGNIPRTMDRFLKQQGQQYPWLDEKLLSRYARTYGTRMDILLKGRGGMQDMGRLFGDGLYEAEIEYLTRHEWARGLDDILWRRTKLGLHVSDATYDNLNAYEPFKAAS
ncbi:MAG: glycerol-3-phosphate dehydrogenase [Micavibrio aeruginosavorus]|uniref:Glycerol-3-phosphate dehydrogenase n=1 Tax=Micavibrio aeruginosavorus TaxID=349221 RepID=A0A7T5UIS3_9BACT|nr:MAG: glycerol-3-phosphate dehydrogenase [Micavibrio aeruginosavorus]